MSVVWDSSLNILCIYFICYIINIIEQYLKMYNFLFIENLKNIKGAFCGKWKQNKSI